MHGINCGKFGQLDFEIITILGDQFHRQEKNSFWEKNYKKMNTAFLPTTTTTKKNKKLY